MHIVPQQYYTKPRAAKVTGKDDILREYCLSGEEKSSPTIEIGAKKIARALIANKMQSTGSVLLDFIELCLASNKNESDIARGLQMPAATFVESTKLLPCAYGLRFSNACLQTMKTNIGRRDLKAVLEELIGVVDQRQTYHTVSLPEGPVGHLRFYRRQFPSGRCWTFYISPRRVWRDDSFSGDLFFNYYASYMQNTYRMYEDFVTFVGFHQGPYESNALQSDRLVERVMKILKFEGDYYPQDLPCSAGESSGAAQHRRTIPAAPREYSVVIGLDDINSPYFGAHHPCSTPLTYELLYNSQQMQRAWTDTATTAEAAQTSMETLSVEEKNIVLASGSVLLLGRSGTGKTTSAVIRIFRRWLAARQLPLVLHDTRHILQGNASMPVIENTLSSSNSSFQHVATPLSVNSMKGEEQNGLEDSLSVTQDDETGSSTSWTPLQMPLSAEEELGSAFSSSSSPSFSTSSDWEDVDAMVDGEAKPSKTEPAAGGEETELPELLTGKINETLEEVPAERVTPAPAPANPKQTPATGCHWNPVFVTLSPVLCSQVGRYFTKLQSEGQAETFADVVGNTEVEETDDLMEDDEDAELQRLSAIPDSFSLLNDSHFPLFLTLRKFLVMLDGTLRVPFFARSLDKSLLGQSLTTSWQQESQQTLFIQRRHLQALSKYAMEDEFEEEEGPLPSTPADLATTAELKRSARHGLRIYSKNVQCTEVNYDYFANHLWHRIPIPEKRHFEPMVVFTEIFSFYRGSYEALQSPTGVLDSAEYQLLGKKRSKIANKGNLDETAARNVVGLICDWYEGYKHDHDLYDINDVIFHIYTRLKHEGYNGVPIHSITVDEVQDFSQNILTLMFLVSPGPESLFFCGDTCQTIARGIGFRFQDLSNLVYESNLRLPEKARYKYESLQLVHNYRCHKRLLALGNSVVRLLWKTFPQTIDKLEEDNGAAEGPMPVLFDGYTDEELFLFLTGSNAAESTSSAGLEFGAHQVVIVRDATSKENLPDILRHCLVLTIFEAKGLEFDDVILYNFFADSPSNQWGELACLIDEEEMPRHERAGRFASILCSELKQLYVAVSRAKRRLFVVDNNKSRRRHIFRYWLQNQLAVSASMDSASSAVIEATSAEAWKLQGLSMMRHHFYEQACRCFERSGDAKLARKAMAFILAEKANHLEKEDKAQATAVFLEAATEFQAVGVLAPAARCFFAAKEYLEAAENFELILRFRDAGAAWEAAGDVENALRCYLQDGEFVRAVRVLEAMAEDSIRAFYLAFKYPATFGREELYRLAEDAVMSILHGKKKKKNVSVGEEEEEVKWESLVEAVNLVKVLSFTLQKALGPHNEHIQTLRSVRLIQQLGFPYLALRLLFMLKESLSIREFQLGQYEIGWKAVYDAIGDKKINRLKNVLSLLPGSSQALIFCGSVKRALRLIEINGDTPPWYVSLAFQEECIPLLCQVSDATTVPLQLRHEARENIIRHIMYEDSFMATFPQHFEECSSLPEARTVLKALQHALSLPHSKEGSLSETHAWLHEALHLAAALDACQAVGGSSWALLLLWRGLKLWHGTVSLGDGTPHEVERWEDYFEALKMRSRQLLSLAITTQQLHPLLRILFDIRTDSVITVVNRQVLPTFCSFRHSRHGTWPRLSEHIPHQEQEESKFMYLRQASSHLVLKAAQQWLGHLHFTAVQKLADLSFWRCRNGPTTSDPAVLQQCLAAGLRGLQLWHQWQELASLGDYRSVFPAYNAWHRGLLRQLALFHQLQLRCVPLEMTVPRIPPAILLGRHLLKLEGEVEAPLTHWIETARLWHANGQGYLACEGPLSTYPWSLLNDAAFYESCNLPLSALDSLLTFVEEETKTDSDRDTGKDVDINTDRPQDLASFLERVSILGNAVRPLLSSASAEADPSNAAWSSIFARLLYYLLEGFYEHVDEAAEAWDHWLPKLRPPMVLLLQLLGAPARPSDLHLPVDLLERVFAYLPASLLTLAIRDRLLRNATQEQESWTDILDDWEAGWRRDTRDTEDAAFTPSLDSPAILPPCYLAEDVQLVSRQEILQRAARQYAAGKLQAFFRVKFRLERLQLAATAPPTGLSEVAVYEAMAKVLSTPSYRPWIEETSLFRHIGLWQVSLATPQVVETMSQCQEICETILRRAAELQSAAEVAKKSELQAAMQQVAQQKKEKNIRRNALRAERALLRKQGMRQRNAGKGRK